jgi:hypothetical protein
MHGQNHIKNTSQFRNFEVPQLISNITQKTRNMLDFFFLAMLVDKQFFLQVNFLESNVAVIELSFPLYLFLACEHFHRVCWGLKNYLTGSCRGKKVGKQCCTCTVHNPFLASGTSDQHTVCSRS